MPFYSHVKMRKEFLRMKSRNPHSKLMGIDLGRKYIGIALSDMDARKSIVILLSLYNGI